MLLATVTPYGARGEEAPVVRAIEEVVVTGSRIRRRDFSSISPIITLDQSLLEFAAQPTLEEQLNQIPQIQPDFGRTSNSPGDGTARLNLRGLGSQRTLVLLNGRRLAPAGTGSAVDLNTIPQALVEQVEVIVGGATAVYGSDAVAGVVNLITKKTTDGILLNANTSITERGDAQVHDVNLSFDHSLGDDRGELQVFAGWLDREELFAGDRSISRVPFRDNLQGAVLPSGSTSVPAGLIFSPLIDLGSGMGFISFDPNGDPVPFVSPDDLFNFAPLNYLQTPLTRYSGGLFLNYDLSAQVESYVELIYSRNEAARNLAPVPATGIFTINLDNPTLSEATRLIATEQFSPSGPNLANFGLRRRLLELGPRVVEYQRDYLRVVAGLRGQLSEHWTFDAWASYTNSDEEDAFLNGVSRSRISQGLLVDPTTGQCFDASGGCVPVDLLGVGNLSAEAAEFIRQQPAFNQTRRENKLVSVYLAGPLGNTWAGPVATAFGAEWRRDEGTFEPDDNLFTGDSLGFLGETLVNGAEEVFEAYVETIVPLAKESPFVAELNLELGARFSDYQRAGAAESYKAGVDWRLNEGLRVRSVWQRSVRAPNLEEAFQEQLVINASFVNENRITDPCSASANPIANGNLERCVLQGIPANQVGVFEASPGFPTRFISGGNPDLVPETAKTLTAGLVFTAPDTWGLQLSVDYFNLDVSDTIGPLNSASVCFDAANNDNFACANLRRDPTTFNVAEVFGPTSNRGESRVAGVDTHLNYQTELPGRWPFGLHDAQLELNVYWTRLLRKTVQENPVSRVLNCQGKFGFPCSEDASGETFPENRVATSLRFNHGALIANLRWQWIGGTDNSLPAFLEQVGRSDSALQIPRIGSRSYLDLGLGYLFIERLRITLNVANLLNERAPFVADASFANNTDTTLFDVFGRSYRLGFSLRF